MAGKPGLKSEVVEELMEAQAIMERIAEESGSILDLLDANESEDHTNDRTRREAMSFLLEASKELNLKNYEKVSANLHAAMQKMHSQEMEDYKDDRPRCDARIKISVQQEKALQCKKRLEKLTEKVEARKNL